MNPYLSPDTLRSEAPTRILAKFDYVEPIAGDGQLTLFSFEGVDAAWKELQRGGRLELPYSWNEIWHSEGGERRPSWDLIDRAPLHRLEFTLNATAAKRMRKLGRRWLAFERVTGGEIEAQVYSGLFAAPVSATFLWPRRIPGAKKLQMCFNFSGHPNATPRELRSALSSRRVPEELAIHDVGQGSANALLDSKGKPILYFDYGCGVHGNAGTRPAAIKFCLCGSPTIVLSHWDADHWAAATVDTAALQMTWIAPRQTFGGPHQAAMAANIVLNGGTLLLVSSSRTGRRYRFHLGSSSLTFQRGIGRGKNGSGIVLSVERRRGGSAWLLTGDVDYSQLVWSPSGPLIGVVVPHHGADMGVSYPAPAAAVGYRRLAYSFGPGNVHGRTSVTHPTRDTIARHVAAGWVHGTWTLTGPIPGTTLAGGDVLATASHPTTHLGGALIGWTRKPAARGTCPSCSSTMSLNQT